VLLTVEWLDVASLLQSTIFVITCFEIRVKISSSRRKPCGDGNGDVTNSSIFALLLFCSVTYRQ
jgi:hypothetical protein